MTLVEILTVGFGLLFAVVAPVLSHLLGYGWVVCLASVVVGFLLGVCVGAAADYPLGYLLDWGNRRERASKSESESEPD